MCGVSVGSSFGSDYFFGGNVLLRWKSDKIIETSKNIYLTVEQAKKIWKKVCKWHEAPWSFESEKLETKSGAYTAMQYKNDFLTAGCHTIAYCEMKRMADEIYARENKQAV